MRIDAEREPEDENVVRDHQPDHEGSRWSTHGKQLTHHLVGVVVVVRISKRRDHVDADHIQDGRKDTTEEQDSSDHGL